MHTHRKVLLVGVEPKSLINFRGDLIKAIESTGREVIAISSELSPELESIFANKGIKHESAFFQRNGLNPFADVKTFFSLYRLFRKHKPELVLCYTIKPVIWGGLAAKLARVPFYALITGLGFAFQGENWKRKSLTRLVSMLYKSALQGAQAVIFQNQDNRDLFVLRQIVSVDKTHVVKGSGVNIDHFAYCKPLAKITKIRFLCIARLLTEKGLREYALAAQQVKQKYPFSEFALLGPKDSSPDGIPLSEINAWVEQGAINYLGEVEDVRQELQSSHVFVLPSYHEGLPRSSIEAMAVGRPIITTNAVGCRETVEEGINGFKVPVADTKALAAKIIWFIENPQEIESMGRESRRMAEDKFDVHKVNADMLRILGITQ